MNPDKALTPGARTPGASKEKSETASHAASVVSTVTDDPALSVEAARALVDRVKASLGETLTLLIAAHNGKAWIALGYSSWTELCEVEFSDVASLALPPGERRDRVVEELSAAGLSQRAIAAATSLSQATVSRALATDSYESPQQRIAALQRQPEGWKQLLDEANAAMNPYRPEPGVIRIPDTIEEAAEQLHWLAAKQSALTAFYCPLWISAWDNGDRDLLPNPRPDLWRLFEYAQQVKGWPVTAEFLQMLERHGIDVLAELLEWHRYCQGEHGELEAAIALSEAMPWVQSVVAA